MGKLFFKRSAIPTCPAAYCKGSRSGLEATPAIVPPMPMIKIFFNFNFLSPSYSSKRYILIV
jgi:hypothetical protein